MDTGVSRYAFLGLLSASAIAAGCSGAAHLVPAPKGGSLAPFVIRRSGSSGFAIENRASGVVLATFEPSSSGLKVNGKAMPEMRGRSVSGLQRSLQSADGNIVLHVDDARQGLRFYDASTKTHLWFRKASGGLAAGAFTVNGVGPTPVRIDGRMLFPDVLYGPSATSVSRGASFVNENASGGSGGGGDCDPDTDSSCDQGYTAPPDDVPYQDPNGAWDDPQGILSSPIMTVWPTANPGLNSRDSQACRSAVQNAQWALAVATGVLIGNIIADFATLGAALLATGVNAVTVGNVAYLMDEARRICNQGY